MLGGVDMHSAQIYIKKHFKTKKYIELEGGGVGPQLGGGGGVTPLGGV